MRRLYAAIIGAVVWMTVLIGWGVTHDGPNYVQPATCPAAYDKLVHPDAPEGTYLCIPQGDVSEDMTLNYGWSKS